MPRNVQGIYSLPAGNPVIPGTLIESTWANPTMSDIAAALTGSLPRNGSAPMQGPLILAGDATLSLQAVPLQQLNATVGGTNSFLPAGAIQLFAMNSVPTGWLECNGAAVSRTTYANLFATIGETYGAGNGTTTFNLPDLRGQFVRGWDNGRGVDPGRMFGSQQNSANQAHTHTATAINPAHTHGVTDPGHGHGISDPGHQHTYSDNTYASGSNVVAGNGWTAVQSLTGGAQTGIAVNQAATGVQVAAAAQNTTVVNAIEGTEARPTNVAMVYAIKAFGALQTDGLGSMAFQNKETVNITGGSGVFSSLQCTTAPTQPNDVARLADIGSQLADIFSSDPAVLLVDKTNPTNPILRPQTNVPFGMVKLDGAGYVPSSVLNVTDLTFLGTWDAAPGLLPTGTFATGDYYQIDVAGTLTLNTSGGVTAQPCNVGDQIIYNAATPGWWYTPAAVASSLPASAITNAPYGSVTATNVQAAIDQLADQVVAPVAASAVSFIPGGTISANNVQLAIGELDAEKLALTGGTVTGDLTIAAGKAAIFGQNADPAKNFKITVPTPEDGTLTIERADGTDVMTIDAAGKVSFPGNKAPAFRAAKSTIQTLVSGVGATILFDVEGFDTSNAYDPATGRFTPQVAGYYQVNADVSLGTNTAGSAGLVSIQKNDTTIAQEVSTYTATSAVAYGQFAVGTLVYMNGTTDYLSVVVAVTATNPFVNVGSFSASFVRAA